MKLLKSLAAWMAFTIIPPVVVFLIARPKLLGSEYVAFFAPSVLIPVVGSLALSLPFFGNGRTSRAVLGGFCLGLALPILGGLAWAKLFPGFESGAAIFGGSLIMSLPSGFGGAVAGWLRIVRG